MTERQTGQGADFREWARFALGRGDEALAEQSFARVLDSEPGDLDALQFLAARHFERGEAARALEHLQQAHRAHPREPRVLHQLGTVRMALADHAGAAADLDKALALTRRMFVARLRLGVALARRRDHRARHPRSGAACNAPRGCRAARLVRRHAGTAARTLRPLGTAPCRAMPRDLPARAAGELARSAAAAEVPVLSRHSQPGLLPARALPGIRGAGGGRRRDPRGTACCDGAAAGSGSLPQNRHTGATGDHAARLGRAAGGVGTRVSSTATGSATTRTARPARKPPRWSSG